jgi:hypothetical protein
MRQHGLRVINYSSTPSGAEQTARSASSTPAHIPCAALGDCSVKQASSDK